MSGHRGLVLIALSLAGAPVAAQQPNAEPPCAVAVSSGSTLRGQVISRNADLPPVESGLFRREFSADRQACRFPIDDTGRFEVSGVAPGHYSVRVAGTTGRGDPGVIFTVADTPADGVTIDRDLPNALLPCLDMERCWALLQPPLTGAEGSGPRGLMLAGLRLGAALGLSGYANPEALCVVDGDPGLLE